LKIAMYNLTTTSRFGGVETFVWEISRELARRGEEVHIIGGEGKVQNDYPGVSVRRFPFIPRNRVPNLGSRFRKLVERWSFGWKAFSYLRGERYDIFHIHKPYDLPVGVFLQKKGKTRLILGSHGGDFFWADAYWAKKADAVVCCSDYNAGEIKERYGLKPVVIYNGINPELFRPVSADPELSREMRQRERRFRLIYAGRLIGLKGVGELIEAMAFLGKDFPVQLTIIGEGEAREELGRRAAMLGLEKDVFFRGFVPNRDLPRHYSVADVGVFPSVADETFGISICEAMACGRPVVTTRVGGIPEVVQDGETGYLAEPRNPRDLAQKIGLLLKDENLRKKMGEKARERVLKFFTWEKVGDRLMPVYERVLKGNHDSALNRHSENSNGRIEEP